MPFFFIFIYWLDVTPTRVGQEEEEAYGSGVLIYSDDGNDERVDVGSNLSGRFLIKKRREEHNHKLYDDIVV